jgi:hypothetical protein
VYARFDFVEGRRDGLWHPVLLSADVVEADLFLEDHAPAVRLSAPPLWPSHSQTSPDSAASAVIHTHAGRHVFSSERL